MTNAKKWPPDSDTAATIKLMVANGETAAAVAEEIGLGIERQYLLYQFASREGIRFCGKRRRSDLRLLVTLESAEISKLLDAGADRHCMSRRDLASKLLGIVLRQGPTFIENLLDG